MIEWRVSDRRSEWCLSCCLLFDASDDASDTDDEDKKGIANYVGSFIPICRVRIMTLHSTIIIFHSSTSRLTTRLPSFLPPTSRHTHISPAHLQGETTTASRVRAMVSSGETWKWDDYGVPVVSVSAGADRSSVGEWESRGELTNQRGRVPVGASNIE